jgi:PPK2 family polyphosphate:nucleotide phosphotransferase
MIPKELIERFRVVPGKKVKLKDFDTSFTGTDEHRRLAKEKAADILEKNCAELAKAQDSLYADDRYALLIILQAMDAAGKDGTIKHVFSGVNPQGCQVFSFKVPSAEELDHTFLWRYMKALPERGRIGIFNRSYYEDVLVVKVHPDLIEKGKLPPGPRDQRFWNDRYDDINNFERHLVRNGTIVLKFFLHVSKKIQKERFLERLDRPDKNWKFSSSDLKERAYWDIYQSAYEDALAATSTDEAPWFVVPADHKWVARTAVADVIVNAIHELDLSYPKVSAEQLKALAEAKKRLEAE